MQWQQTIRGEKLGAAAAAAAADAADAADAAAAAAARRRTARAWARRARRSGDDHAPSAISSARARASAARLCRALAKSRWLMYSSISLKMWCLLSLLRQKQ